jgi:hypothetical protein
VGIRCAHHATPFTRKSWQTSPTSGGRSVGIIRLRTKATEFFFHSYAINALQLPKTYNIQNFISLIHTLKNIEINENTKLCSFDIENMYTNILVTQVKNITKAILDNDYHTTKNENTNNPIKHHPRTKLLAVQ